MQKKRTDFQILTIETPQHSWHIFLNFYLDAVCNMKFYIFLWVLLNICTFAASAQQDPQVSQHMFNHLMINPGFAGNSDLVNLMLLNRQQWVGFPGAPATTVFQADASLKLIGDADGVGFTVVKDAIGYESNVSFGLDYSYRFRLGQGQLGCGASFGMMNKKFRSGFAKTGSEWNFDRYWSWSILQAQEILSCIFFPASDTALIFV